MMRTPKNILLTTWFVISQVFFVWGQHYVQATQKAVQLFNNGAVNQAIAKMHRIARRYDNEASWTLLVKMSHHRCQVKKRSSPQQYPYAELYYHKFIDFCRQATLRVQSPLASQLLRNHLVDYVPDSNRALDAQTKFKEAEAYFFNQHYEQAVWMYRKVLEIDSNYYKANLYLGDCYYFLEKYDSAIFYLNLCKRQYPSLLEPRKYLTDVYMGKRDYDRALNECIETLLIYPDVSMFAKLASIAQRNQKKIEWHWIRRTQFPNRPDHQPLFAGKKYWKIYCQAQRDIAPYCDKNGILSPNPLTQQEYLETYSWEVLLRHPKTPTRYFAFARQMLNEGFLDCYVFISLFHHDLYPQYQHFVQHHSQKIKIYLKKYLLKDKQAGI